MQSSTPSLTSAAHAPRGATAVGAGFPLQSAIGVVWRFVEAFSQRKAAAEILELANALQATRPETAAQMRRAVARSWD